MSSCAIYTSQGDKLAAFTTDAFSTKLTIGRSSECTVCLKGLVDTSISRVHLVMVKMPIGWKVINHGKAGMYHDCIKVKDYQLKEGDVIRFAGLFLTFGETAKPSLFDLCWDAPTEDGKQRAVLWPGMNSIGASHDNYVMIRTEDISRIHAFITVHGNHAMLRSATPSNETLVNGLSIGETDMEISPKDELQLADTPVKLVPAVRYSLTEAPVQVAVKRGVAVNNSDSVNNATLMYVLLGLFTLLVTFILFLTFKLLG